jgi:hypothetical protein
MTNTARSIGRALCALALGAVAASGTSVSQTQTPAELFDLNSSENVFFNGFNPALGTLTGVTLTLTINENVSDNANNSSQTTGEAVGNPIPLSATALTDLSGPGGLDVTLQIVTAGFVGVVPPGGGIPVGQRAVTNLSITGNFVSPPTNLSGYIGGANSVSFLLSSSASMVGTLAPNVSNGVSGDVSSSVELDYIYAAGVTSTPEPGTVMLLGPALLGIGLVARRFKR